MCGICGIIDFSGRTTDQAQRELLTRRMLARMRHRGPDHHDAYSDSVASVGAVRLSILDRSAAGNQPMRSSDGRFVLVYNGEIYNYRELRRSLEDKGDRFRSDSDTEVLLRLYETKGEACLHDLRGMFSFAVWDLAARSLFLARDRAGEKPLVYTYRDGCFAFASEITALLELPWVSHEPNWAGIHYGLHFVHVPAPVTAFAALSKLPPANTLVADAGGLRQRKYWQLRFEQRYGPDDKDKCCRDLRDGLDETIRLMSLSDVPVGAFLSGGLDSSAVTASLAAVERGLPTFRIGHPGPENKRERAAALAVSARYGTRHHDYTISRAILDSLHEFVSLHAEPTGTMVALDYFRLALEASRQVTVVLSGNGADELYGGYDLNIMESVDRERARWVVIRPFLQERVTAASAAPGLSAFAARMQELDAAGPHLFYANRYLQWARRFTAEVYTDRMKDLIAEHEPANLLAEQHHAAGTDQLFNATTYQMLNLTCQYSLVDHGDICGMASSLEVRSPFLDVRMMELAAAIPPAWKVGRRGSDEFGKMILREAMEERLPESVRFGVKQAFGCTVPYGEWLRSDWERLFERDALGSTGLFDIDRIDRMVREALAATPQLAHSLFNILTLSVWCSMYQRTAAPQ